MSDFERRLRDALGEGAESAPDAGGLAEGARRRLRTRRRRLTTVGAVVAVAAVAVPVGLLGSDDDRRDTPDDDRVTSALENQQVTCGGDSSWPVAAMDGGVPGLVNDAEVRAAFARLLEEAPMDAPETIREQGADHASYIVFNETSEGYTLGTGRWTTEGPGEDAFYIRMERDAGEGLEVVGWGKCELRVATPEDRSSVKLRVPRGGVDGSSTSPVVMATENECTSGRDPEPFLGEPQIVEDDQRVLVTMTSERSKEREFCIGNPSVPVTLHLDGPIGDRELLDGSTWPPTPLTVATPADPSQTGTENPSDACPEEIGPAAYNAVGITEGPSVTCRMELSWKGESGGTFLLDQATTLTDQDEQRVEAAIGAAPEISGLGGGSCRGGPGELYLILTVGQTSWVYNSECHKSGVEQPGRLPPTFREVTTELLDALGSSHGLLR